MTLAIDFFAAGRLAPLWPECLQQQARP